MHKQIAINWANELRRQPQRAMGTLWDGTCGCALGYLPIVMGYSPIKIPEPLRTWGFMSPDRESPYTAVLPKSICLEAGLHTELGTFFKAGVELREWYDPALHSLVQPVTFSTTVAGCVSQASDNNVPFDEIADWLVDNYERI